MKHIRLGCVFYMKFAQLRAVAWNRCANRRARYANLESFETRPQFLNQCTHAIWANIQVLHIRALTQKFIHINRLLEQVRKWVANFEGGVWRTCQIQEFRIVYLLAWDCQLASAEFPHSHAGCEYSSILSKRKHFRATRSISPRRLNRVQMSESRSCSDQVEARGDALISHIIFSRTLFGRRSR